MTICDLRASPDFRFKSDVDTAFGAAVGSMGVRWVSSQYHYSCVQAFARNISMALYCKHTTGSLNQHNALELKVTLSSSVLTF